MYILHANKGTKTKRITLMELNLDKIRQIKFPPNLRKIE